MFYVRMTDKFMSGWGMAKGIKNVLVIECDTLLQANAIEVAAHHRNEMIYINVTETKPRSRPGQLLTWKKFSDMGGTWLNYYRAD